jgi:hypothetical protein
MKSQQHELIDIFYENSCARFMTFIRHNVQILVVSFSVQRMTLFAIFDALDMGLRALLISKFLTLHNLGIAVSSDSQNL